MIFPRLLEIDGRANTEPLLQSPKLRSAPAPNRATIAFPESDRPGGHEPAMPLPRLQQLRRPRDGDRRRSPTCALGTTGGCWQTTGRSRRRASPADDQQELAHRGHWLFQTAIAAVPRQLKSRAPVAIVSGT